MAYLRSWSAVVRFAQGERFLTPVGGLEAELETTMGQFKRGRFPGRSPAGSVGFRANCRRRGRLPGFRVQKYPIGMSKITPELRSPPGILVHTLRIVKLRLPSDRINWDQQLVPYRYDHREPVRPWPTLPVVLWAWTHSQVAMFFMFFIATGPSASRFGYHPPFFFPHGLPGQLGRSAWSTLIFGAAAFENCAPRLGFRSSPGHHKHVDHDDDPYGHLEGFSFHAHIGWIPFQAESRGPAV